MTKVEIIEKIAEVNELSKKEAKAIYNSIEDIVTGALEQGEDEIKLGFATIKVKRQEARVRRNPATQEEVQVPAKNVAKIKLSSPVKNSVAQ